MRGRSVMAKEKEAKAKSKGSFRRPSGKWTDILPVAIIITMSIAIGCTLVFGLLFTTGVFKDLLLSVAGNEEDATLLGQYFSQITIWIAIFLVVLIVKFNRPMIQAVKPNKSGNNFIGILIGLALGFGANASCVLLAVATGSFKLKYNGFNPGMMLLFFCAIIFQAAGEEIVMRFYLYQKLRRRYRNPWIAIIANGVVFMLMHAMAPTITVWAVIQMILVSVICSLLVYCYDGIWIAMALHIAWNYSQLTVFGLPNSGTACNSALFSIDGTAATGFFYDAEFGVEGSIGGVLVLSIICAFLIVKAIRSGEKNDLWA